MIEEDLLDYWDVTRIERLEICSWKDIENLIERKKKFGLNRGIYTLLRFTTKDSIYYLRLCKDLDTFYFELKQTYIGDDLCEQMINKLPKSLGRVTKENYRKALAICVKLFKGEEV